MSEGSHSRLPSFFSGIMRFAARNPAVCVGAQLAVPVDRRIAGVQSQEPSLPGPYKRRLQLIANR
jgi:hypothetical protein